MNKQTDPAKQSNPSTNNSTIVTCPTCKKAVDWVKCKPWSPFCSERCKQIDLGAWAGEEHRIAGEKLPPQPDEDDSF